jgi:hypothetical protein
MGSMFTTSDFEGVEKPPIEKALPLTNGYIQKLIDLYSQESGSFGESYSTFVRRLQDIRTVINEELKQPRKEEK